jgi:hypothetical protein
MTDEPPADPPPRDAKGRLLPGAKIGRGRPKGSENKFGPGFRDRLMAGISRAGTRKAKKAGVNQKVDGIEYYAEHLADTNSAATASIISKLIPPEAPQAAAPSEIMVVNVHSIDHGQQFSPGGPEDRILMPFEMTEATWAAYHGGQASWKTYLGEIEGELTAKSFARLSRVVAPDRDKLLPDAPPSLRLVREEPMLEPEPPAADEPPELAHLTIDELKRLAGVSDDVDQG